MRGRRRTRQPRRSREQWAAVLAEQERSGLSQRAFCASRGVVLSSFANARRRIGGTTDTAVLGDDFVALGLDSATTPSLAAAWDIELSLGAEVVLRIRSG